MPSCPHVKTCCCCCTTETGTKVIGWLQAIGSIIGTLVAVFFLVVSIQYLDHPPQHTIIKNDDGSITNKTTTVATTAAGVTIVAASVIIYLLSSILAIYLLVGVYKRNMSYVRLWVVISTVLLCITLAVFLVKVILLIAGKTIDKSDLSQSAITMIFEAYFIIVVYSFYRDNKGNAAANY